MAEAAVPKLVQPEPVPALAQDDVLQIQYRGAELKLSAREDGKPATSESRMWPYACGAHSKNHVRIGSIRKMGPRRNLLRTGDDSPPTNRDTIR